MDDVKDYCWQSVVPRETLEIYKAYHRELYIGSRPALLVIDLYNCVFPPGPLPLSEAVDIHPSSCGENAWNAIQPIANLIAFSRDRQIPIIHTTSGARRSGNQEHVRATNRNATQFSVVDYDFYPVFKPQDKERIIYKDRASAFFGTPLIAHLTQLGINTIMVCGESTSGCVRATVVDGYSYGFHMVVFEETVFDRSTLSHQINLFDLHHKYADVLHLCDLQMYWSQRNGGDIR
ncbi:isochorismatase family protein [Alicyclobacillus fastidiosus]|uniref:Isochorismatase family protein n=1 Tax=Alicyclobacillus fastidiosus TaxID=392011 RepID=A0ABY6ZNA9_9BACL|nr:isochorismatase family protein [Alicyclobacillus fastidiosus]WAH43927.1 isochorismatase family protein [Alicyclobacillus fastidiosus]GMA60177.1 hydrolase [Alicyclobacillus fastidiosus]